MLENFIEDWRRVSLENYQRDPEMGPAMAREHVGIEDDVLAGGYGYRQVLELIQNGADAVLEEAGAEDPSAPARIHVLFDGTRLYVANTGAPLSKEGIKALLTSHASPKRGDQIGRFGIGFKSLLRLGGTIDILGRGGSLRFDPPRCQQEVRAACKLQDDAPAPSLRLAWTLDRVEEAARDPRLRAFDWAETVVRAEVGKPTMADHLTNEITDFPARFLLFIATAVDVTLEAPGLEPRQISRTYDDDVAILHDGQAKSRWRLIKRLIQITEPAPLDDATHIHRRDEIPLTWAIPLDAKREEAGNFWVFFPTKTQTRIPGVLNAPWKVGNDRQSVIDGEWNRALMRAAATMIAEALPTLADTEDPARALDYLPRQHEPSELAATLVEALWVQASRAEIVPDATGALRIGEDLHRHPTVDKALVKRWCQLTNEAQRTRWVHPDCLDGDRRARLRALADRLAKAAAARDPGPVGTLAQMRDRSKPRLAPATAADWFAATASEKGDQTKAVILLAAEYANSINAGDWNRDRPTLRIVPDRKAVLRCPDDIWLARPEQSAPGRHFVADDLVSDQEMKRILRETLRVPSLLSDNWLPILEQAIKEHIEQDRKYRNPYRNWSGFWQTLRSARPEDQKAFALDYNGKIRVRRQDGSWQYPYAALLPGEIVSATDTDAVNHKLLVDLKFHRADDTLLRLLGVTGKPEGKQSIYREVSYRPHECPMDEGFGGWTRAASGAFWRHHPRVETKSFVPYSVEVPRGSCLLAGLTGRANARLTSLLLTGATEDDRVITLLHHRRPNNYKKVEVEHPLHWLLRTSGSVAIGSVTIPLATILARCDVPVLAQLADVAPVLPAIQQLAGDPRPKPADAEALDTFWQALADHLVTPKTVAGGSLTSLWRSASADGWVPKRLPGPAGDIELGEVYVTGSADLARRARARGWTVVDLDEETRTLWRQNGAKDLDLLFARGWDEPVGSFTTLSEVVPEVATVLSAQAKAQSYVQVVNGLHLRIGEQREAVPGLHWEGVLYLDQTQLAALAAPQRLRLILAEAAAAGWLDCTPVEAMARIADATLQHRRREVAEGADLAERLLRAVAGDVHALRLALGEAACRALPEEAAPEQIARLLLDLLGPAVLQDLYVSAAMKNADLRPPARWGTDEARAFAGAIGFPEYFALSQSRRLDAELLVAGPLPLPPLHPEYQVEVFDALKDLIESGNGRRRAVVSLPTGGGKTRVVVQAAVELILKRTESQRTVLWVAQTNELCEQAVQSFRQVWQNLGTEGEALRVVRFWGGNGNPKAPADTEPTVVVASIQTLNSRFDAAELAWIARPGLVVVDECHHAITRSYTSLLRWLDAEAPRPSAPMKDEPPFLGLSATPFRMDDDESMRLAKRFDQRWHPRDQSGLHERLLAGRFLARAEHQALETETSVSPDLLDELERLWDSDDAARVNGVLERVNKELAANDARNARLIKTLQASDARQVLFFTNSVRHAEEMAARLCLVGIPAAAVSGETPATARRWFLDRFKSGDLRVLCNHSVLTTGFDAPRTDLVLIARQVKSPVSYMQMVGRGLRGPRNGGTETCTILTVLDNLGRFRERHPFHYCADLYKTR